MSHPAGNQLDDALLVRLSAGRAVAEADSAIVICTIDDDGRPHPAMLSSLELVAIDVRNIRLTLHAASRSARNLRTNGKLTLILADAAGIFYIKGDVRRLSTMVASPDQEKFNMRVESVLQDNPAAYENARVTSGIRVERGPLDLAYANAILRELTNDARPLTTDA